LVVAEEDHGRRDAVDRDGLQGGRRRHIFNTARS
jgi:hypothetical protein